MHPSAVVLSLIHWPAPIIGEFLDTPFRLCDLEQAAPPPPAYTTRANGSSSPDVLRPKKIETQATCVVLLKIFVLFIYLAALVLVVARWIFSRGMWDLVPDQGWDPSPLLWELGVLATGLPGQSPQVPF